MSTAICVCGPYHGTRVREADDKPDVVTIDGAYGGVRYVLHHRMSLLTALFAAEGSSEKDIAAGVFDLAKSAKNEDADAG